MGIAVGLGLGVGVVRGREMVPIVLTGDCTAVTLFKSAVKNKVNVVGIQALIEDTNQV